MSHFVHSAPLARAFAALAVAAVLSSFGAGASAETNHAGDPAHLHRLIQAFVRANSAADLDRVELPSLDRFRVSDEGGAIRADLALRGGSGPASMPVAVSLWRGAKLVKRGVVAAKLHGTADAWVARRSMRSGERIRSGDLTVASVPLKELHRDALAPASAPVGLRVRRSIRSDQPVRATWVEPAPIVERGQPVRLLMARGALRIETVGRALEDGNVGDWIRTTNTTSRREVVGRVGRDGAVHVDQ